MRLFLAADRGEQGVRSMWTASDALFVLIFPFFFVFRFPPPSRPGAPT